MSRIKAHYRRKGFKVVRVRSHRRRGPSRRQKALGLSGQGNWFGRTAARTRAEWGDFRNTMHAPPPAPAQRRPKVNKRDRALGLSGEGGWWTRTKARIAAERQDWRDASAAVHVPQKRPTDSWWSRPWIS